MRVWNLQLLAPQWYTRYGMWDGTGQEWGDLRPALTSLLCGPASDSACSLGLCLTCKADAMIRWLPGSLPAHNSQTPGMSVSLQTPGMSVSLLMHFALYTNRKELQLPQERRGNYWHRGCDPDSPVVVLLDSASKSSSRKRTGAGFNSILK